MLSLRTRRALLALVVPALVVPLVPSAAEAARPGPGLPKLAAVARIYPHLAEGHVTRSPSDVVTGVRDDCEDGRKIDGAVGRSASYSAGRFAIGHPAKPSVDVSTLRFGSAGRAEAFVDRLRSVFGDCFDGEDVELTYVAAQVGDEHFGYLLSTDIGKRTLAMRWLVARDGRYVVFTGASSLGKGKAPALDPFVRFTRLALRAAR